MNLIGRGAKSRGIDQLPLHHGTGCIDDQKRDVKGVKASPVGNSAVDGDLRAIEGSVVVHGQIAVAEHSLTGIVLV